MKRINKKINKKNLAYEAIFIIAFLFIFFWLFSAIRSENFGLEQIYSKNGGYIFIFSLITLIVGYINRSKLKEWLSITISFLSDNILAVFGIMILFQIIILLFASGLSGYDVALVYHAATEGINSKYLIYFQNYPNNFLIFLFMKTIHSLSVLQFLNIIAIDFSIALSYFTAKKLFEERTAKFSILLFMATFGFSPWLLNTYSDTFVLPFVSLGIFLLATWTKKDIEPLYRILILLSAGFVSSIAYYLKPSAIIFVIAYFLIFILKIKKFKPILMSLVVFFIGALLFAMPLKIYTNNQNYINFDKNKEFPITHWMMMGSTGIGGYNSKDVDLTQSAKTSKEKKEVNIKVFKERLKNLGIVGYAKFLYEKFYKTTCDGAYSWGADGNFLITANLNISKTLSPFINSKFGKFLRSFIYTDANKKGYENGKYTFVYRFIAQIIYIIVILGVLLSTLKSRYDFNTMWLLLSLIGLMVFLLIFEGGRSRYLIQALPIFIILSGYGYSSITQDKDSDYQTNTR